MISRALVVNADDFGLTPGVNAGILDSHLRGILTSASLFANAPATDDAIRLARRTPTLGVGCHLTLVDGEPVLPSSSLPTLAPDGRFRPRWGGFIANALAGRLALREVELELTAQIDRVRSSGIPITHLDGHKHVHAYPPVFAIVARLARRFGIPALRVPCESPPARLAIRYLRRAGANRQALENLALTPWAWYDRRVLRREGIAPAPRFLGRALTGLFTPASFHALLRSLRPGLHELMLHPGFRDPALDETRTRLREARVIEASILTDPGTLEIVRDEGIILVNHARTEMRMHVA